MPHMAITMDTHTGMEPTGSTSVKPRLSQRLMPTMLVPMDMEDSLPIVDMVSTHTAHTATDIPAQLTTDLMPTVVSTSVMLRPSQRLMRTTVATMDTQPTAHMDMELTHTDTLDTAAHTDIDTTTKYLLKLRL